MKKLWLILLFISFSAFAEYERVISTSPAFTEIIYKLEVQNKLVGVSPYCHYPEDAKKIEKTGSPFDFNTEKAIRLKADLVLLAKTKNTKLKNHLNKLGLKYEELEQENLAQIYSSITKIGELLGKEDLANELVKEMKSKMSSYQVADKFKNRKALIIIGHKKIDNGFEQIFVMEPKTFYQDVLNALGLKNAISSEISSPLWSTENLQRNNPDIIIDIILNDKDSAETLGHWKKNYSSLKAVKENNVYVISSNYALIPGPRIPQLVEEIYKRLKERP